MAFTLAVISLKNNAIMKLFWLSGLFSCALNFVYSQNHSWEAYEGIYSFGDYSPIYSNHDDGTIDSGFSFCSYGQLELYHQNDTMYFSIDVCNATYHIGSVRGKLEIINQSEAEFKSSMDDEFEKCHLKFKLNYPNLIVDEVDCQYYHGARASFDGEYSLSNYTTLQNLSEKNNIKHIIESFFTDFNKKNIAKLDAYFYNASDAVIATILEKNNQSKLTESKLSDLKKGLSSVKMSYKEEIGQIQVFVEGNMAVAWMKYSFYLDNVLSHCGVNKFDLMKSDGKWLITGLTDNHFKTGCAENGEDESYTESLLTKEINLIMDKWHKAAAEADEDTYFPLMHEDCIYLGTDPGERWTKEEFISFAMPHFQKEKAWAFTANWRNVYFNDDYSIAWFEESLDTWMGECRGSGILVFTEEGWKIKHYNLSVTIVNDKIQGFIDLIKD